MADPNELRMNLAAIKRVDPYAKDIVDSSAHVAFYTFNSEDNEWEKTDVEGAFFIYSRNAEPFHSIFINNRLNTNSFVEPITSQLELQSQPPFLLYRNERSRIRGFWFYNSSECDRIGELVGRLIKECEVKTKITVTKNQEMIRPMSNNVDIFSMLSKAQQDFNNSQNQSTQQPGIGISTGGGNVGGGSGNIISDIMNNRGKSSISDSRTLSSGAAGTTPGSSINSSGVGGGGGGGGIMSHSQNQPDVTSQSVMNFFAAAKPAAASEVPLFQRLLSNPVSVDQIEKQQRATTPQDGRISPPQLQNTQDLSTSPLAKFLGSSNIIGLSGVNNIHNNNPINKINNSFESGNSSSVTSCLTAKLDGNNIHKPLQKLLKKEPPMSCGQLQMQQSSPKPALMPPTMFLSSSVTGISKLTQQPSSSSTAVTLSKPEPLTQTQLLQAMMYLIQNDPEFIKKLHEAYLKSFTDMVSL